MSKNNKVDTAQKGQTTNNNSVPTGKVKTLKSAEERRKIREEQFRNFRINALKRRANRMGLSNEEIEEAIKKLKEQMDAPKEYSILIMLSKNDTAMFKEALAKEGIKYAFCGEDFVYVNGNQNTLAKVREIAPNKAKIHPYAKKMESVLPKKKEYSGYVAKNTDKSSTAKGRRLARKAAKLTNKLTNAHAHDDHKLHAELQKQRRMNNKRKVKKALKKLHIKLSGVKKKRSSIVVQMPTKKASKGSKTLKKAA